MLESGALCAVWSGLGAGFLNAVRIYTAGKSGVLLVQPASCKKAATKVSLGVAAGTVAPPRAAVYPVFLPNRLVA